MEYMGTHETIVVVIDGIAQSVNSWNYTIGQNGERTFYIEGVTEWQLTFTPGTMVSVIR